MSPAITHTHTIPSIGPSHMTIDGGKLPGRNGSHSTKLIASGHAWRGVASPATLLQ